MRKTSSTKSAGLTIGKRIALGFGAVLALMVGVTAYGIRDVTQIDRALTAITDVNAVKQRHGINFRGSVHDRAISLRDVVLVNDRAGLDKAIADIARLEKFYADSAHALDVMLAERADTNDEERSVLGNIKAIEASTMPLVKEVVEARLQGNHTRAHGILLAQAAPAFSEWLARINRYIDLQEARNQEATAVARATASAFSWVMISLCAAAIVLGAAIAWLITRGLLRSLGGEPGDAARIVARIASGDLSSPVPSRHPDSMLGALAQMQDKLKEIFTQIVHSSAELSEKAEKVGSASREARTASALQAEASSASATSIAAMTESMRAVASAGHETQANSERTSQLSEQGTQIVASTAEEIARIAEIVRTSSARISDLQRRSEEIGGTAQVIKEIADQTNLLALNAAIEAARAGESGRGFAVVADEVRKLAERTSVATSEIAKVIEVIQADTREAVSAMEKAGPQVEHGLDLARQSTTTLADIHRQADSSLDNVRQVARTAEQQVSTAAEIADNVEKIATMSAETNDAMHSNTSAAEDLQAISSLLRDHVARFKLA